jgi:osmoprotectant transport system permease protein
MEVFLGGVAWLLDPVNWQGRDAIPARVAEHLMISGAALATAIAIALPLGLWIGHTGRLAFLAVNLANLGRAIPSYALMAMIFPLTLPFSRDLGPALIPTFVAMSFLAIPPILVTTYTGIREVDRDVVEAGRGVGMRERDILRGLELPLAVPVILGGIRTSGVQVVATTTLGAWFGLGGLGRYLQDGLLRGEHDRLWAGVLLVAALAIATELSLAVAQRRLTSVGIDPRRSRAFREPAAFGRGGAEVA